jgi:hypothetical protein
MLALRPLNLQNASLNTKVIPRCCRLIFFGIQDRRRIKMATKKEQAPTGEPNYWILVLANKNQPNKLHNAQVVFDAQLKRKVWGLKENGKNFKHMRKGDIVLLYIGRPYCVFAGYAVISEEARPFNKEERTKLLDKKYRRKPKAGIKLSRVKRFNVQVPVPLLVPELTFIKNKKNWGMYFQGSANKIDQVNFEVILSVACMLNPSLKQTLKPRVKSQIVATFNPDQRVQH